MSNFSEIIRFLGDPWLLFGFFAQFIFFLRFIVQWYLSEKHKRIVIPKLFWHLSILGAFLILIYSLHRKDPVFIVSGVLQMVIFSRSLFIYKRTEKTPEL